MLYSALSIGYLGVVTHYTLATIKSYQSTKAPNILKQFRNGVQMVSCSLWYTVGVYTIYQMGAESLFHLLNMDDEGVEVIQQLPSFIGVSFLLLNTIILAYRWYCWYLTDNKDVFDHQLLTVETLGYVLQFFMAMALMSWISSSWFAFFSLAYFCFNLWCNVISTAFNIYERTLMSKKLDEDLIFAQIYLDLTSALLMSILLFNVVQMGDVMLDVIMCLKAATYIGLKTAYDIYLHGEFNLKILFQILLCMSQLLVGIGLLYGLIIIPESALVSIFIFKILKGSAILIAWPSIIKNSEETLKVQEYEKQLLAQKNTQALTVKEYLFFKKNNHQLAKKEIWENNAILY